MEHGVFDCAANYKLSPVTDYYQLETVHTDPICINHASYKLNNALNRLNCTMHPQVRLQQIYIQCFLKKAYDHKLKENTCYKLWHCFPFGTVVSGRAQIRDLV